MKLKLKRTLLIACLDAIVVAASFIAALYLRLGGDIIKYNAVIIPGTLAVSIIAIVTFFSLGLYRIIWRYASLHELLTITKAVAIVMLSFLLFMFLYNRLDGFPRSVFIIQGMLMLAAVGGMRFMIRASKDSSFSLSLKRKTHTSAQAVFLIGLNDRALHFLRETVSRHHHHYRVTGIVERHTEHTGCSLYNVPVLGTVETIDAILQKAQETDTLPDYLIAADDHLHGETLQHIVKLADNYHIHTARLPSITDMSNQIDHIPLRPIALEDLLGRTTASPQLGRRQALIKGKKILVTGAGGSIGSELVRQIASFSPQKITLYDISEFHLYTISMELRSQYPTLDVRVVIADVRDSATLDHIFQDEKPQLVFHAAALKHVPLVESNVIAGITTNVLGTRNVAKACIRHHTETMVMVSTDKAVSPTNVMGLSKRVAECYIQGLGQSKESGETTLLTVRFGNVMGSSGSAIPLFKEQLKRGGPITITHPDMQRYFMTVPEAVELILQAASLSTSKEHASSDDCSGSGIYVLDMGDPIYIKDLAMQMIRLAGLEPDKDIKIEYIGIRPGEKLYEELFYDTEIRLQTAHEQVLKAFAEPLDIHYIEQIITECANYCQNGEVRKLLEMLQILVPQYQPFVSDTKQPIKEVA